MSNLAESVSEQTISLPQAINRMKEIKDEVTERNAVVNKLKKELTELEFIVMDLLRQVGIDRAATDRASVSLKTEVVPNIEDWETVCNHLKEQDMMYLLKKGILTTGYRELLELGEELPGVSAYEKTKINFTSL